MRQAAFTVRRIGLAVTYAPAIGKRRSGRRKPKDILIIIVFLDECPNRVNVCADGSAENEAAHSDRRRLPRGDGEVTLTPTWIALKGNLLDPLEIRAGLRAAYRGSPVPPEGRARRGSRRWGR